MKIESILIQFHLFFMKSKSNKLYVFFGSQFITTLRKLYTYISYKIKMFLNSQYPMQGRFIINKVYQRSRFLKVHLLF